jgi:hypothetical protein
MQQFKHFMCMSWNGYDMKKHRMDSDKFNRNYLGKSGEVHFRDIAPESLQKESLVNWLIFSVPWPDWRLVATVAHIQTDNPRNENSRAQSFPQEEGSSSGWLLWHGFVTLLHPWVFDGMLFTAFASLLSGVSCSVNLYFICTLHGMLSYVHDIHSTYIVHTFYIKSSLWSIFVSLLCSFRAFSWEKILST